MDKEVGRRKDDSERARQMSDLFVMYVHDICKALRIDPKTAGRNIALKAKMPQASKVDLSKMIWNEIAPEWPAYESDVSYQSIMYTLLEALRVSGDSSETILSLGAGPGLYESFLANSLQNMDIPSPQFVVTDYAERMVAVQKRVFALAQNRNVDVSRVKSRVEDMTNLSFPTGSVDQIICNNSLQWVPDWQKAISEMARVINPQSLGYLYLIVHRHKMTYELHDKSKDKEKKTIMELPDISFDDLITVLEANNFEIQKLRLVLSETGVGQRGNPINRVFIHAQHRNNQDFNKLREVATIPDEIKW